MTKDDDIVPMEVFSGLIWEAEMIKSLLESENINSYLKDEFTGTIAPWYTSGGAFAAVTVIVSSSDYENAMIVVKEFENNRQ